MEKKNYLESINLSMEKVFLPGRSRKLLRNTSSITILRQQLESGERDRGLSRRKG